MSLRPQLAQLFQSINVAVMCISGLLLMFYTETMVPGVNPASKGALKCYGSFSLVYGLLLASLGSAHHGAYCLTMTLHFCLLAVNTLDMAELKRADGSFDPRLAVQTGYSYIMFFCMITLLVTGGIGNDHGSGAATTNKKGGKSY